MAGYGLLALCFRRDNRCSRGTGSGPGVVALNFDPASVEATIAYGNGDLDGVFEVLSCFGLINAFAGVFPLFVMTLYFHIISGFLRGLFSPVPLSFKIIFHNNILQCLWV